MPWLDPFSYYEPAIPATEHVVIANSIKDAREEILAAEDAKVFAAIDASSRIIGNHTQQIQDVYQPNWSIDYLELPKVPQEVAAPVYPEPEVVMLGAPGPNPGPIDGCTLIWGGNEWVCDQDVTHKPSSTAIKEAYDILNKYTATSMSTKDVDWNDVPKDAQPQGLDLSKHLISHTLQGFNAIGKFADQFGLERHVATNPCGEILLTPRTELTILPADVPIEQPIVQKRRRLGRKHNVMANTNPLWLLSMIAASAGMATYTQNQRTQIITNINEQYV